LRGGAGIAKKTEGITILLLAILLASWGWRAEFQARNAADEQTRIANEQRIKAEEQTRIAEEQARVAESRRLAAESSSALAKYPQRSLLLAVEAVKVEQPLHGVRVAAAEQSLREAVRRRIICESFSAIYEWWRISLCSTIVRAPPENHCVLTQLRWPLEV
jgi:hypothetical protein